MGVNSSSHITSAMLDRMERGILKNRHQLAEIKRKFGDMSYFDYSKQKNRINLHKPFQRRKNEIIDVVTQEAKRLLGSAVSDQVGNQLKKNDSLSTAEHTGPIGTEHTLGSALSASIPMCANPDPKYKNVIILSCSGVSFNNNLSLSRGFKFHTVKDKKVIDNHINFFGRAVDSKAMIYSSPFTASSINECLRGIENMHSEGNFSKEYLNKISLLLKEVYVSPHALTALDFPDQMTITNYHFWRRLFHSYTYDEIPNYVMLSQEKIVLKLLLNYHLSNDTPLHRFIFDREYNSLIEKYFDGIIGAFNKEAGSGTFLFWNLDKNNIRKQLIKKGNKLVAIESDYEVELNPDSIRDAILNRQIFPSLLLTFITLSFYYGLLLGGGASQPTYLTQMKKAYFSMMSEIKDFQSEKDAQAAVTDDYIFFRPHIAFINFYGERVSATGMDMYLYNKSAWKSIVEATKSITVNEFITILYPILYKQFCPENQREDFLMNIARKDVEKFTGFDKKLPSLFEII